MRYLLLLLVLLGGCRSFSEPGRMIDARAPSSDDPSRLVLIAFYASEDPTTLSGFCRRVVEEDPVPTMSHYDVIVVNTVSAFNWFVVNKLRRHQDAMQVELTIQDLDRRGVEDIAMVTAFRADSPCLIITTRSGEERARLTRFPGAYGDVRVEVRRFLDRQLR